MIRIVCGLGLVMSSFSVMATEVITNIIPGLHDKKGTGEYDLIIKQVASVQLVPLPTIRAEQSFQRSSDKCFSPANKNPDFYPNYINSDIIESKPMGIAKVYIFTAPGKPVISSLSELKGKKVGARLGFSYGNKVDTSGVKLTLVNSLDKNIKKLQSGRIDAMIDFVPDVYLALESLGVPELPHDKSNPVAVHNDSVICKKTAQTEEFIAELNQKIK